MRRPVAEPELTSHAFVTRPCHSTTALLTGPSGSELNALAGRSLSSVRDFGWSQILEQGAPEEAS